MRQIINVAAVFILLSGCAGMEQLSSLVKQPTVSYKSLALGRVTSNGIELKPTISLLNTNAFSVPVDSVDYDFSLGGKQLFSGQTSAIGTLSSNVAKDVILGVNLTGDTLKSLQHSLLNNKQLDYKVAGSVKVMGIALPFEHAATLYVPQVSIGNVSVSKANMSNIELLVTLEIENGNDFVLPLDNINYSLASAGKHILSGNLNNQQIKQGKNTIVLPLSLATSKLVSSVFSLMKSPNIPLEIKVKSPLFNMEQAQTLNLSSLF